MVDEKKKPLGEYQTAIMVGLGAFVVILIMGFAIGWPLVKSMNKSKDELQAKQAELEDLKDRLTILQGLEAKKDELTKQSAKVLAALPEDSDVSRLFVQFEKIATENGLTIQSVSGTAADATQQPSGTVTPATYTVTGSAKNYSSLKTALGKIESALRVISVSKADLNGNSDNIAATFTVTTYVRGTQK